MQTLTDHKNHCLDQVAKFAAMKKNITQADRPYDILLLQMGFNWGRWTELAAVDGRAEWQWLEKCILEHDYDQIISRAAELKQQ